ncbi:Serine/threonine phosphatase stp [Pontiella desulfatans]|uniref:Serine/threonine phosphatase stp n=2 Tax=Pontiella desulfatans TaxID=2750659 RepID=A0A6C2TXG0_PONDE|nr:Serine/threonine phosphatase stp [Pontiella desulfatans]
MGGASGGDLASQKTVELIEAHLSTHSPQMPLDEKIRCIADAANEASDWIFNWAQQNQVKGTGTTLVSLVLSEDYPWAPYILHAGDSRIYLYRGGGLRQVSTDHSIEEAIGNNDGKEIPSQFKGLITNALGLKRKVSLEVTHSDQQAGDIWILCSDGLSNMVSDSRIGEIVGAKKAGSPESIAQTLVDEANKMGGRDNISVVVVRVDECSELPEGAAAIPFENPLPRDASITDTPETAATESLLPRETTDSSDLVSIQTAGMENTGLHTVADDATSSSRWRVWLGLGVVVVLAVVYFLTPRAKNAIEEPRPNGLVVPERAVSKSSQASGIPSGSMADILDHAVQTGDWAGAYRAAKASPERYASVKNEQDFEAIQAWKDFWDAASGSSFDAAGEFGAYQQAYADLVALIGRGRIVIEVSNAWPAPGAGLANAYCRKIYSMQLRVFGELDRFSTEVNDSLAYFKADGGSVFEDLCHYSADPAGDAKTLMERFDALETRVKGFRRWVGKNERYPVEVESMSRLSASTVAAIIETLNGLSMEIAQVARSVEAEGIVAAEALEQKGAAIERFNKARDLLVAQAPRQRTRAYDSKTLDSTAVREFLAALDGLEQE